MKSAGKARSNGLYRHIRTSKEIIRNLLNDSAKKQKLEIASANGRIIESPIHKRFENLDDLRNLILTNLQISNFKNFHDEGIIIVDNLEAISEDERINIKHFIDAQTPAEMQFLLTSRNSEDYEVNFKLSGFEKESGITFVKEYIAENSLDLNLDACEIEELLTLAKGTHSFWFFAYADLVKICRV